MLQLQSKIPPTPSGTDARGKTIIITGANSGLGFEAARQFLLLGASRIILACRSLEKGQQAIAALQADPEVKKVKATGLLETFELDLDDYQSGLRFAKRVKAEVQELDILLNNGGIAAMSYQLSKSGHEKLMQVNCYTHILICLELFPLLRSTAAIRGSPTRITFVGSATQIKQESVSKATIPSSTTTLSYFDDKSTFGLARYADSKLFVSAYVRRLGLLAPDEVIVNNLCPGLVQTDLDQNLPAPLGALMRLVRRLVARTVEEGGRTLIHAAVVASSESNGKFLRNNQISPAAAFLDTPEGEAFIDRLWRDTLQDLRAVGAGLEGLP
ncbi:hypothetical protein B0T16DRAFT_411069 [Cercophora newfieldiana]|uniref:Uncharacterized protein n=1 Tax=Cercophora newfieldiana TaxID=92897 RepID=A0AA39YFF0_9PEZI|nr:hypothetical protein B0T16DRAFT_411069 [Cercophora newfieldiana]